MKKRYLVALCGGLLIGCGGSGGFNSGFPDAPQTKLILPVGPGVAGGTTLRTFRAGDAWVYDVSGNMLREEYDDQAKVKTKNSGPVSGQMVRQVSAVTFQGQPAFKITDALTYAINGGLTTVEVLEYYGRQEANGDFTMLGRRDQSANSGNATKPWLPATFGVGVNRGGATTFTGLGTFTNTSGTILNYQDQFATSTAITSTAPQNIAATTGPGFDCWRSVYAEKYSNDFDGNNRFRFSAEFIGPGYRLKTVEDISSVDDWSPVIGAPVQRQYQTTRTDTIVDKASLDSQTGAIVYEVHLERRTLDLKMVLKQRTLQ